MYSRYPAAAVAALAGLALVSGCQDNNILRADIPVATDTLVAYALTGTSATLPSALAVTVRSTVRVDGSASFDVGFDINSQGQVVVSPVRLLVNQLSGAPPVGIQVLPNTAFEDITRAPGGYYRPDTAVVVSPGEPFVLLVNGHTTASVICLYDPAPTIYSKVVIDSVQATTTRAIYMRVTTNPDCGYRSFLPGVPSS